MPDVRPMTRREPTLTLDVYLAWPPRLREAAGALEWTLDAAERARLGRFAFAEDRLQYAAAHALLREVLAARVGGRPRALEFTSGAEGRPALARPEAPGFSLTRRRGLVACAVGPGAVGVDVEDAQRPLDGGAEAALTTAERAHLAALPPARRAAGLLQLWTLKAAWLKARGAAASQPLASVEALALRQAAPAWTLRSFEADGRHLGSLAAEGRWPVRFFAAAHQGGAWRFQPLPVTCLPPPG